MTQLTEFILQQHVVISNTVIVRLCYKILKHKGEAIHEGSCFYISGRCGKGLSRKLFPSEKEVILTSPTLPPDIKRIELDTFHN